MKTAGGHWRIRRPFSLKTRFLFAKIRGDFDGSIDIEGDWEPEAVYSLLQGPLHQLALGEYVDDEDLSALDPKRRLADSEIKKEIYDRFLSGKPLNDLQLFGEVYRFWLEYNHCPTVGEMARFKCISRSQCYRLGYSSAAIRRAYHAGCERIRTDLPGHDASARAEGVEDADESDAGVGAT